MTIAATHTVVKSAPVARRFGQGLLRFVPAAVTAPGFVEPSEDDRRAAAAMFGRDDDGIPYDVLAGEAAYIDAVSAP